MIGLYFNMLLKADASALEWRVKVFLSQDKLAMREIREGLDIHTDNAKKFGLPDRGIAKIFLYRMIFADAFGERGYNGPAYAYANDPDFSGAGLSIKKWEGVIERFFTKYPEVYSHSLQLILQVSEGNPIVCSPSGREYQYERVLKQGEWVWPHSDILNHIVQGFSADLILLARRNAWRTVKGRSDILLINTVHDDIEADCEKSPLVVFEACKLLTQAFKDIDKAAKVCYNIDLNVPMSAEVKFGKTLFEKDMIKFNEETFEKDYEKCVSK